MSNEKGQKKKKCFVISPIGDDRSPVRKHADRVFRFIIEPAMDDFGIEPIRSDRLKEPGLISEDMWKHIREDDLCVAVITYHNPNVFYELAIAQALGRPVIVLAEEGTDIPFDIHDLRVVRYDMEHEPLFDGLHAKKLAEQVGALEAAGYAARSPFGHGLTPLGGQEHEITFFARAEESDYARSAAWFGLLQHAESVFEIMGIGLNAWRNTKGFGKAVIAKAAEGCSVRVMLTHAENPALRQLINDSIEEDFEKVIFEIQRMFEYFSALAEKNENIQVRRMLNGCLHFQLARTDTTAVCVPYLYSEQTRHSPVWQCTPKHPLYATLAQEFESLWEANEPAGNG